MTKFQRQNELKDLGFLPLKREDYSYCLTYGQGHNDIFPIEYRERSWTNAYEVFFFGCKIIIDNLDWDDSIRKIVPAMECLATMIERNHARACTASTN